MSIFSELSKLDTSNPKYEKHIRTIQNNVYSDIEDRSNANSDDTYDTNKDVLLDSKEDSSNDTQDNSIQQETDSSITSNTESIQENKHIQAIQVQHTDITNNEHDIVNITTNHTENLDINTPIISQNDRGMVSNEGILSLEYNDTLKDSNESEKQNQRSDYTLNTHSDTLEIRQLKQIVTSIQLSTTQMTIIILAFLILLPFLITELCIQLIKIRIFIRMNPKKTIFIDFSHKLLKPNRGVQGRKLSTSRINPLRYDIKF